MRTIPNFCPTIVEKKICPIKKARFLKLSAELISQRRGLLNIICSAAHPLSQSLQTISVFSHVYLLLDYRQLSRFGLSHCFGAMVRRAFTNNSAAGKPANISRPGIIRFSDWKVLAALGMVIFIFLLCQALLPLSTAIRIGGDEGFELSKALLCVKGHHLYSEIWNDQPPLHTFLLTQVLKHVSPSILYPRLLTTAFAILLLAALFLLAWRVNGLATAAIATALLVASPGFLSLASSCMLEIPALATAVAALSVLVNFRSDKWPSSELIAGAMFGLAMEIKLVPAVLLPLAGFIIWLNHSQRPTSIRQIFRFLSIFFTTLIFAFVAADWLIDRGAYLAHFKQSWISHFTPTKSFEYGSPADHPFDWKILLRNWDATIPAVLGIIYCIRLRNSRARLIVPTVWLAFVLLVFGSHTPWWSYYYVHIAIPLCWCAAIGIVQAFDKVRLRKFFVAIPTTFLLCALPWMFARVYLQITTIRNSPQTYTALVLKEVSRYKPFTEFIWADEPVYSFHTRIPLPPDLAVLMLKRLWSGDMTNAKITAELETIKPGIMILNSDTRLRPYGKLLQTQYRLVYDDGSVRLYVEKALISKAQVN